MYSIRQKKTKIPSVFGAYSPLGVAVSVYLFSTVFDFVGIVPGVSPARLTGLALIIFVLFKVRKLKLQFDARFNSLILLLFGVLISLVTADDPVSNASSYFSFVINAVLVLAVLSMDGFSREDKELCVGSLIAGAAVICVIMIAFPTSLSSTDRSIVSIMGYAQDPNELCGYFFLAIAVAFSMLIGPSPFRMKILFALMLAVLLYCTLITGSRGGLIAVLAIVSTVLIFVLGASRRRVLFIVLVNIALLLVILNIDTILAFLPDSISSRYRGITLQTDTVATRITKWSEVLTAYFESSIPQKLFGHGLGGTMAVTATGHVAHNAFIELLYSFGIFGFLCQVFFLFFVVRSSIKNEDYIVAATIIGFLVLWMSLSAISLKSFWAVLIVAAIPMSRELPLLKER